MRTVNVFFTHLSVGDVTRAEDGSNSRLQCWLHFSLDYDGTMHEDLRVEVSHPWGTDHVSDPIEAGPPIGWTPPTWDHERFREICEDYYRTGPGRSLVESPSSGSRGVFIGVGGTVKGGTIHTGSRGYSFEVPGDAGATW